MVLHYHIVEFFGIEVSVDFRGGNATMPQHLLNIPQIYAVLEQMRGKRMPKSMRRDALFNPSLLHQIFND